MYFICLGFVKYSIQLMQLESLVGFLLKELYGEKNVKLRELNEQNIFNVFDKYFCFQNKFLTATEEYVILDLQGLKMYRKLVRLNCY